MTTPKSFHHVVTLIEKFGQFIISNLLKIAIFAKYFSPLIFTLLLYVPVVSDLHSVPAWLHTDPIHTSLTMNSSKLVFENSVEVTCDLPQVLEFSRDIDVNHYVANCLKMLFVHGQCLNLVYKTQPMQINEFLQQQFIPRSATRGSILLRMLPIILYSLLACYLCFPGCGRCWRANTAALLWYVWACCCTPSLLARVTHTSGRSWTLTACTGAGKWGEIERYVCLWEYVFNIYRYYR